jgi:hypothetical protein
MHWHHLRKATPCRPSWDVVKDWTPKQYATWRHDHGELEGLGPDYVWLVREDVQDQRNKERAVTQTIKGRLFYG